MNIQMQICGMIILVVLAVFYKSNRTLKLYSEGIFFWVMIVATTSLSLDILSLIAIEYRQMLPLILVHLICKTYIISLIWVGMSGTFYVLTEVLSKTKHQLLIRAMIITTSIQGLIVYALPIYIHEEGKEVFTYGPAVLCVYLFALLYVIATLVIIIVYRNRVSRRRRFAVSLWMIMWIIAAVVQFLNNELLLVGFATAMGVLILLVIMENPESNLDRRLGCFNSYALSEYAKELFRNKKKFSVLNLSFGNKKLLEDNKTYAEEMLRGMLNAVNRRKKVLAFKNTNADIVFISDDGDGLYRLGLDILSYFTKDMEWHKETSLALVKKCDSFADAEELFGFLTFLHTEYVNEKERVLPVGESIIEKYKKKFEIEQMITDALAEDRVEVFLQPIYSTEEHCFTSAEALVRIREKDGSLVPPGLFIPVAEESGQILELGERVFEKVCSFLKNSEALKMGLRIVEINLSVIQCERRDLAERLIAIVDKYEVSPEYINLEITETASISARATLLANMKKLMEYGFKFSLDDFGKGESNLMYVVEMPVSIVKLDYDLTKSFFGSSKAKLVLRAVVGMAHGMELKLVAEGIETKEELISMCKEGIDYIQGFYYSKPLPMWEYLEFMEKKQNEEEN
ncbi:MAG: EAL domain-containing protein [Lachnospiraceae bacterium]|nr:EAL domain-containing protein [Lachnospiraceae bacterium]